MWQYFNYPARYIDMEAKQTLTIVLPVRNRAKIVGRTLESIACQTCRDFRLIIVDNNSDDSTLEVVSEWAKNNRKLFPITILSEQKPGAASARNRGLKEADTPYTMFFDSDDVMRPTHIARIIELLASRPDTEIVRWDVAIIDNEGWMQTKSPRFHDEMQLHLLHGSLATQRWAAKTELIRNAGGWNEELSTFDDLELGVKMLCYTNTPVRIIHGEPTVAIYDSGDESISGINFSSRADHIAKAFDEIETTLRSREHADGLRIMKYRRAIIAARYKTEGRPDLSKQMMSLAISGCGFKERIRLKAVYLTDRIFGRGASALSLYLAGKKREIT